MEKLKYLSTLVRKKVSVEMENKCLIKISGVKVTGPGMWMWVLESRQ